MNKKEFKKELFRNKETKYLATFALAEIAWQLKRIADHKIGEKDE